MCNLTSIKEYLQYCKDTGNFYWIKRPVRSKIKVGDKAGSPDLKDGYWRIYFSGKPYPAHRIAFLFINGNLPRQLVDHINGVRDDNRWCNLREATYSENCKNIKKAKNNTLGFVGIYKSGNRWIARAMHNKKMNYLGCYATPQEAALVYDNFCKKTHAEFYQLKS